MQHPLRLLAALGCVSLLAAAPKPSTPALPYPPTLPDGQSVVSDTSPEFLKAPATLLPDVAVAKTAPTVDFLYVPGQDYAGNPWSNWGDSLAADGKYYFSVGDHLAPAGNAFVYEFDPATRGIRRLADVRKTLQLPDGHYTPGKIHGRLDMGKDGWLYFSTHRGSTRVTTDAYYYLGDWILRTQPASGRTEIVAQGAIPKHCLPCSALDGERMIFYAGSAPGDKADDDGGQFLAYDVSAKKVIYSGPNGPDRYMMLAKSTGRVYFNPGKGSGDGLVRFDPAKGGAPEPIAAKLACRAATQETPDGYIYAVSQSKEGSQLARFNTKDETTEALGPAAAGSQQYITSIDADGSGRYLYYIPGAHGGSEKDNSAVVQYDTRTKQKKIIAFLGDFYKAKFGCTLKGTFSSAVDPAGDKLYITWNNSRGSKAWDSCVLTVIHIPASERP